MSTHLSKQLWVTSIVYFGQLLCGYIGGWSSNVIIKLQDPYETPLPTVLNSDQASYMASSAYLGIIGPYIAGFLSNYRGRKPCLVISGALGVASFLVKALAKGLSSVFTGRVLASQAAGIIYVMNLVYIAEISSTNIRGILLAGTGVLNSLGMLVAYAVGPSVSYTYTCYLGLVLAIWYTIAALSLPESPIYCVLKGQKDKARETLIKLGREDDIDAILATPLEEPGIIGAWFEIFTGKSNSKAMFVTLSLMMMQQLSGVMVVILFAMALFSKVSPEVAHLNTIKMGGIQLIASCVTLLAVERVGRRFLLMLTTALCSVSLLGIGYYFYLQYIDHPQISSVFWLPFVSVIVFLASYNIGFGIIPGTLAGELFDSKTRGPGTVFTVTVGWVVGFAVSHTYVYMLQDWGNHTTYWVYAGVCALAFAFTCIFVPETKGKSLLEIQEMLSQ